MSDPLFIPAKKHSPGYRELYTASSMAMASMWLCLVPCVLAVAAAAEDQTGRRLMELSASIRDAAVSAAIPTFSPQRIMRSGSNGNPEKRPGTGDTDPQRRLSGGGGPDYQRDRDDSRDFDHLRREFARICDLSDFGEYRIEGSHEIHASRIPRGSEPKDVIRTLCRDALENAHTGVTEFEIICWAAGPTADSLITAVLNAETLRQATQAGLSQSPESAVSQRDGDSGRIRLRSSGRVWGDEKRRRPLITVQIRSRSAEPRPAVTDVSE